MNYDKYIRRLLREQLSKQVKSTLLNPESTCRLISNYIDEKISNGFNEQEIKSYFDKLSMFFDTYDFFPNPDVLTKLLKTNKTLEAMTKILFEENRSQIIDGTVDSIFENSLLTATIETYCMLKGIEIKEESPEIEYDTNYLDSDIVKQTIKDIHSHKVLTPMELWLTKETLISSLIL